MHGSGGGGFGRVDGLFSQFVYISCVVVDVVVVVGFCGGGGSDGVVEMDAMTTDTTAMTIIACSVRKPKYDSTPKKKKKIKKKKKDERKIEVERQ